MRASVVEVKSRGQESDSRGLKSIGRPFVVIVRVSAKRVRAWVRNRICQRTVFASRFTAYCFVPKVRWHSTKLL